MEDSAKRNMTENGDCAEVALTNIDHSQMNSTHARNTIVSLARGRSGWYFSKGRVCIFLSCVLVVLVLAVLLTLFLGSQGKSNTSDCRCVSGNDTLYSGTTTMPSSTTPSERKKGLFEGIIQLPRFILPTHYDLLLKVDLDEKIFSGSVNITVTAKASTAYVIFHRDFRRPGYYVDNTTISVESLDGKERFRILKQSYISLSYFHILHLGTNLTKDQEYSIKIGRFKGRLESITMKALYLSSYKTNTGVTR